MADVVERSLPRRHAYRVDAVNGAETPEIALRRMFEWVRAELAHCAKTRPQDADGFRWQIIHLLTPTTAGMYRDRPDPAFRGTPPKLPGGGWAPRQWPPRAPEARHP